MSKQEHTISKQITTKPRNNKRQSRKGINKKGYNKRNTRYMTNSKINEEKTSKKITYSMKKKAHKRDLKKSTRVDEENKNRATGKYFFYANCA